MYKFKINIPIYNCYCHVIISSDIEKVINKYVKIKKWSKDFSIEDGASVHGYAVTNGNVVDYYIFYDIASTTPNYIAHEISHVIDYIVEEKDLENKGEARAYLTGFLSEKIFDFLLKKNLLISKWIKKETPPAIVENQKTEDEKPSGLL